MPKAVCFNHLIDENTDFLYRRLNDNEASVKRTCLMTLTFLILAGQVKVKGQLGEMAKCLEDSDKRIADLSRMFFTELATKDNAVYNHFVDMFSLLSAEKDLKEDAMKRIVKFLASFIEKVIPDILIENKANVSRTNTQNNSPKSLQPDFPAAKQNGNGTMLLMHFRCFRTKTKIFRKQSPRDSGSFKLPLKMGYGRMYDIDVFSGQIPAFHFRFMIHRRPPD
jgi:hypothetical protein